MDNSIHVELFKKPDDDFHRIVETCCLINDLDALCYFSININLK